MVKLVPRSKLPEIIRFMESVEKVVQGMILEEEIKKLLKELTNLNEKSATIGAGKLANIKEQAQYLLDKLNKE